jgi:hypothetical protein
MPEGFIPPHGGYRKLLSYQRTEVVCDATVRFCARFLGWRERTVDQMAQAARSGKQNIIREGGLRERMTRARRNERARHAAGMAPKSHRDRKA